MARIPLAPVALAAVIGLAAYAAGPYAPHKVQSAHVFHTDLGAAPIPTDWILAGKPRARMRPLVSAQDGGVTAALWDCTAGTFKWHFSSDELVHILEGQVTVSSASGPPRTLTAGGVAYFSAGTVTTWKVDKYVKKLAILRDNREPILSRAQRRISQLLASL